MERMKETHSSAGRQGRDASKGIAKTGEQGESSVCMSLCVVAENKEPLVRDINLP